MKRQSVTLTRRFLDLITELNEADRLIAYDKILNHLFNEIPIETKGDSDAVRVMLACLAPELRKAQAQYDNGKISKKLATSSQGFFCPVDGSQIEASDKRKGASIDNNIIITNNQVYTNNQSNQGGKKQNYTFDALMDGNIEAYTHALEQILKQLQPINAMIALRTAETLSKIVKVQSIKIKGNDLSPVQILKQIYETVRQVPGEKLAEVLEQLYNDIDTRKITNKSKYEIMSLYNIHTRVTINNSPIKQKNYDPWHDHLKHNYTHEQLNSIFDNLDDTDI